MHTFITSRTKYITECYRHSRETRIAVTVAAVLWIYGVVTEVGPMVEGVGPYLSKLPTISWHFLIAAATVALVFILIEGGYRTHLEAKHEISRLQSDTDLPTIQIKINEVIVMPFHGYADCFINFMAHNITGDVVTTMQKFECSIEITDKSYVGAAIFDSDKYERVVYGDDYDDETRQLATDIRLSGSDLKPFNHEAILNRGIPINGWLHFRITGVPKWPERTESIGEGVEYDEEGNESPVVYTEVTLKAKNILSCELTITDAFARPHSAVVEKPVLNSSIRAEKKKNLKSYFTKLN
jgi:hypothetical protein